MSYPSLCFLSFNRCEFIEDAIRSAVSNAGTECEVIVHDDGSIDRDVRLRLHDLQDEGLISHLLFNPEGHNEGVGRAINRMFSVASGDTLWKLDQDLLFKPDWLLWTEEVLRSDGMIAMLGLFKYHHDPVDWAKMYLRPGEQAARTNPGYHYTKQFCGSAFGIPREVWNTYGPLDQHLDAFNEDSNFMAKVIDMGQRLALPNEDLVTNRGFGYGPSTVCIAPDEVQGIHHGPLLVGGGKKKMPERLFVEDVRPVKGDTNFRVGVVITTCAGREKNLERVVACLNQQTYAIDRLVVVFDGCSGVVLDTDIPYTPVYIHKHEPGDDNPRNVGHNMLMQCSPDTTHVWFLDSDLVFGEDTLDSFHEGWLDASEDRILIGAYDWLAPGTTGDGSYETLAAHHPIEQYDPRWASFDEHGPDDVLIHDLGAALACFGGNLIWPAVAFDEIGGFWNDIHHGRCEDGELGLRACERGIPMSFVRDARALHVWHPRDLDAIHQKNIRDVPLLNARHPWVEQQGLLVVDKDGKRFDWRCPKCGGVFNSLSYWEHAQACKGVAVEAHTPTRADLEEFFQDWDGAIFRGWDGAIGDPALEPAPLNTAGLLPARRAHVPAPEYIKYLPIEELRESGILQEVNRLVLHPLGLALEVKQDIDGWCLSGVWDFRDDPEGVVFEDGYMSAEKAAQVAQAIEERGFHRQQKLGYVIQPLPADGKQLKVSVLEPVTHTEKAE